MIVRPLHRLAVRLVVVALSCAPSISYAWDLAQAAKPYRGQEINISLMSGYEVNKILLNKVIPEFEKQTGITVTVHFVSYQDVIPTHTRAFEAAAAPFELVNVDNIWFPAYVEHLQPLDGYMRKPDLAMPQFDINDFIPEILQGYQWTNRTYCFPATFEFPILMLRKDLLRKAGFVDAKGNVLPPRTLAEYYQYAKALTSDSDGDGTIDVYGTTLHGYKTGIFDEVVSWYWGMGGELFDERLDPIINNKKMIDTLTVYRDIYRQGYADPASVGWELGEAAIAFRTGKAAMSWNWTMVAPWVLDPSSSYVAKEVIFAPLFRDEPEQHANLREASNALCIPKNAKYKEAAFLFVQWYTSSSVQQEYIREPYHIHPSRKSVIFSEQYAKRISYAHIQQEAIQSHRIRLCPKIVEYPEIDQRGGSYFQQVMTGALSPKQGAELANQSVKDLLQKHGYDKVQKPVPALVSGRYP